ncbi:hypothetical protein HK097_010042 [Rhizophlyctis rosea]|uniref:Uncharacterized protein n=1 Tax=Rhizophlyctis rosea TaxID=64517 RepID=A0AAD5X0Q3_9FUNG|nr:hypothetical protein HK097_010042 [Rhizophlyctis rosea]
MATLATLPADHIRHIAYSCHPRDALTLCLLNKNLNSALSPTDFANIWARAIVLLPKSDHIRPATFWPNSWSPDRSTIREAVFHRVFNCPSTTPLSYLLSRGVRPLQGFMKHLPQDGDKCWDIIQCLISHSVGLDWGHLFLNVVVLTDERYDRLVALPATVPNLLSPYSQQLPEGDDENSSLVAPEDIEEGRKYRYRAEWHKCKFLNCQPALLDLVWGLVFSKDHHFLSRVLTLDIPTNILEDTWNHDEGSESMMAVSERHGAWEIVRLLATHGASAEGAGFYAPSDDLFKLLLRRGENPEHLRHEGDIHTECYCPMRKYPNIINLPDDDPIFGDDHDTDTEEYNNSEDETRPTATYHSASSNNRGPGNFLYVHVAKMSIERCKMMDDLYGDRFISSCCEGNVDTVVERLKEEPSDVHYLYAAPIRLAAYYGQVRVVQALLDAGSSLNAWGGDALASAAGKGHVDVVELLLKRGASVGRNSHTIEFQALYNCTLDPQIIKLLVSAGAIFRESRRAGYKLSAALKHANPEVLEAFVPAVLGAEDGIRGDLLEKLLAEAKECGKVEIVAKLFGTVATKSDCQ